MTSISATSTDTAVGPLARRDLQGFTSALEKKTLIAIARRLPAWVSPDHLTGLGVLSLAGAGLCYRLLAVTPLALLGVNGFLFLNWFGDSLDGTLARVREKQRPRYGFYVDHLLDAVGAILLFGGLSASGLASMTAVACLLIAYLLLQIHIALKAHATGIFQIAFAGVGGTEARLLLGTANVLVLLMPDLAVVGTPLAWVAAMTLIGLVFTDGLKTGRNLDREERLQWLE